MNKSVTSRLGINAARLLAEAKASPATEDRATARPWRTKKCEERAAVFGPVHPVDGGDRAPIAMLGYMERADADAELIVKAVNSYAASQKRIEVLEAALTELCGFLNVTPLRLNEGDSATLSMLINAASGALKEDAEYQGVKP